MEDEELKGTGVRIKEGNHQLLPESLGVVIENPLIHPLLGQVFYVAVAGKSVIHPERIIINTLRNDEFEVY